MDNIYDSNEEKLFADWCEFLKKKNYIADYYKNLDDILTITDRHEICNNKCLFLLHPWTYKYDFKIKWNKSALNIFYSNIDNYDKNCYFIAINNETLIDIKGMFTRKNRVTDITFPLVQKALYQFYNIYIQKVIPLKLFKSLFATNDYLLNDNIYKVGLKKGQIKEKLKDINEFLNGRKKSKRFSDNHSK